MTPEGKVKAKGRSIMKELMVMHWPNQAHGGGVVALPDDSHVLCGLNLQIEYKADMRWSNKKTLPRSNQIRKMDAIRKNGGATLVVDKNNIYDLKRILLNALHYLIRADIHTARELLHKSSCGWTMTYNEYCEKFNIDNHIREEVESFDDWKKFIQRKINEFATS